MRQNIPCTRAVYHLAPQFGIGDMHRDIERTETLLFQALPVFFFQVGQCDKIAKEERVAIIVVLDVERIAHTQRQATLRLAAFRQALNKAKDALISALPDKW